MKTTKENPLDFLEEYVSGRSQNIALFYSVVVHVGNKSRGRPFEPSLPIAFPKMLWGYFLYG